jgi:hypothetical protein
LHDVILHVAFAHPAEPFAAVQAFPQAPQLLASVSRLLEHPLPEQLPNCGLHEATPQTPAMQLGVPLVAWQTCPHALQSFTSEPRAASQPLASEPSQFENPGLHVIPHVEFAHVGVPFCPLHVLPQPPQFAGEVLVSTSQPFAGLPSQSANGGVQLTMVQAPLEHPAVAFGRLQTVLQTPQCEGFVWRFVSHPSPALPLQSPKPAAQVMEQTPFLHAGVPFVALHTRPHPPQF